MSDKLDNETTAENAVKTAATTTTHALETQGEKLEDLENIDFLLEEIENKIAPLALA